MEVEFESRSIRPGSLIWSEDNVLALLTPSILHIFAPSLKGVLSQSIPKFSITSAPALTVQDDSPPWRLMGDVANIRNAMSPQIEYIMASWSPTGCSPFKGCILACITSKHSVIAYIPSSSQVDKQWKKHATMDRHIAAHLRSGTIIDLDMADKVESVSLAWSPKILMGNIGSLLALGNKSGDVTIWHITDPNNIRCVKTLDSPNNTWIVRLSWSPWIVEDGIYTSILSFASADGSIYAHKLIFNSKTPLEDIEASENIMLNLSSTLYPCTVMRWSPVNTKDFPHSNILAFSKGNRLNVWLPNSDKIITWRKPIAKAIADISWDTCGERMFVFFMDGKHSVLRLQAEELAVDEEYVDFVHQEIISRCHVQEKTNISKEDGETDNANGDDEGEEEGGVGSKLQLHIVSGDRSACGLQLATTYYVTSSFHMEFQRDRFQSCTVVLSKGHKDIRGDYIQTILDELNLLICLPNSAFTRNPSYHLWDIMLLFGESLETVDSTTISRFFDILDAKTLESHDKIESFSKAEALPDVSTTPEYKLQAMIFDKPLITADRVSIYIWNQMKSCIEEGLFRTQLEKRAQEGEKRIREHCTYSILNQFVETISNLAERDLEIKERDQCVLLLLCDSILIFHSENEEMVKLVGKVYEVLKSKLQDQCDIDEQLIALQEIKDGKSSGKRSFSYGRETCPACDCEVTLGDTTQETCRNGHTWRRCSISLLLLSDFHPRTCLGCRRKTLMRSRSSTNSEFSWLDTAIQACSLCCYCGERYYTSLQRR